MSQRRLTAILAADVVGYSRLMGEDETGTLEALKAHRRDLFDPEIARRGGRTVKLMGDGVLVEFPSVVDAVEAAMTVQRTLAEDDGPIQLRMGINLGDVIVDGDEIYGDGVNVAARLEAEADPGAVCVSSVVHESIRNRVSAGFTDLGLVTLKNIEQPLHLYQWSPDGTTSSARTRPPTSNADGQPQHAKPRTGRIVMIACAVGLLIGGVVAGAGLQMMQETVPSTKDVAATTTPPTVESAGTTTEKPEVSEADTGSRAPEPEPTATPASESDSAAEEPAAADTNPSSSEVVKSDETVPQASVDEPEKPAEPVAVPGDEIAALLNGKTLRGGNEFGGDKFALRLAEGGTFRGEIKFNDAFGSGGVDSGRWTVRGENLCVNFLTFASGRKICANVMRSGDAVVFKAPSGRDRKWTLSAE